MQSLAHLFGAELDTLSAVECISMTFGVVLI